MNKVALFLLVVVGLIIGGMILSFYGSQAITQDLISDTQILKKGDSLEITAELDPSVSTTAVYVVQTMRFQEGGISAKIFDPFGIQIISKQIDKESFEDTFEIIEEGTYKLAIENSGEETEVIGVLGHLPKAGKLPVVVGFYLLIAGMIGMVVLVIYVIKEKRKNQLR